MTSPRTFRLDPEAPPADRRGLGAWGQRLVRDWGLEQDWTLLASHVTFPGAELDLVFLQPDDRVSIGEVRVVRQPVLGQSAGESLTPRKVAALQRGAEMWIATLSPVPPRWHFHLDAFLLEPHPKSGWELTWVPDLE